MGQIPDKNRLSLINTQSNFSFLLFQFAYFSLQRSLRMTSEKQKSLSPVSEKGLRGCTVSFSSGRADNDHNDTNNLISRFHRFVF
jgi:hypothetical protein